MELKLLLLINLAATWTMVGLIWFVQVVHYPLMANVGEAGFANYEQLHTRLTTYVVGPPMLIEIATAAMLLYCLPTKVPSYWMWVGIGLILVIWIATAVFSVPMHGRLEKGFDTDAHRWLVQSNWIRTFGWTARGVLMAYVVKMELF